LGLEHFEHLRRKRQRVRRVIEQRIGRDFDFVKVNMWIGQIHANRRCITDEMNIVTACGQFLAELRRHDAGAAISRVAGDADAHEAGAVSWRAFRYDTASSAERATRATISAPQAEQGAVSL